MLAIGVSIFGILALAAWRYAPRADRSAAASKRVRPALEAALRVKGLRWGAPVFIRIFKEEKELELWIDDGKQFKHLKTWPICKYSGTLGPSSRKVMGKRQRGFILCRDRE